MVTPDPTFVDPFTAKSGRPCLAETKVRKADLLDAAMPAEDPQCDNFQLTRHRQKYRSDSWQ